MNDERMGGRRVLVTGGAGVIGRELLKLLLICGSSILSLDRVPLPKGDWRGIVHIQKDLAVDSLKELWDFQPEILFHLAATFERSNESLEFWDTNWHDNILLSHRIIQFTKQMPSIETFVFASSYLIYSPTLYLSELVRSDVVSLKEDDPVEPRNLCGAAKYYTEREINFVKEILNRRLRTVYARIFRVYGCGSRDVISRWIRAALIGKEIEVYNKQSRFDFIFARDVAEGLVRLSGTPDAEGPVNLGSGVARSIQEVLELLPGSFSIPLKIGDLGIKEPFEASCANLMRLKQLTGWVPSIDLPKGIRTITEFEENK